MHKHVPSTLLLLRQLVQEPTLAQFSPAFLFYFVHHSESAAPAYAIHSLTIRIMAPPDKYRFSYYMVFRNEAPVTGICTIVTVIAHHPVIVHLEGIAV